MPRPRRLLLALVGALVLTGCRLDVQVALTIDADGTGELAVTATADADLVARVPGLADDLRFDDAVAAGWVVEGPAATEDGGATVTLRHSVTSAADATNLLASLGPPFVGVTLGRDGPTEESREAANSLNGQLQLANGFDTFADSDLLAAVGGTPFADDLAATGATPATSMSVTFRADLPGEVLATTGDSNDGALEWVASLDGSSQDLATETVQRSSGGGGGGFVSTLFLVLLIAWVALAATVIVLVVGARQRRRRRRPLIG